MASLGPFLDSSARPRLGFLPPGAWSPRGSPVSISSPGVACPAAPRPWETSPCHSSTAPPSPAGESPSVARADPTKGSPSSKARLGSPPPLLICYTPPRSSSHCRLATRENQDPPLSTSYLPFPPPTESATKPLSRSLTPWTSLLLCFQAEGTVPSLCSLSPSPPSAVPSPAALATEERQRRGRTGRWDLLRNQILGRERQEGQGYFLHPKSPRQLKFKVSKNELVP